MSEYREINEELQERKSEEMRVSIQSMLDNMQEMKAATEMNAALLRVAYTTLIAAGFTEAEAFELIARKGVMLS